MSVIAWIVVGLVAGIIAKAITPGAQGEPGGLFSTIGLGMIGALLGGFLSNIVLGSGGATGINLSSIIIAVIGSCIFIGILRLIQGARPSF